MDLGARGNSKWLSCVVSAMRAGQPLSRELVGRCYRSTQEHPEPEHVAEAWVDYLWKQSKDIPREEFLAVRWWSRARRAELLHRIFA